MGLTSGLGSMDQDDPFQFSTNDCGWKPPPPPPPNVPKDPTAQQADGCRHEMLLRMAPVELLGAGTDDETSIQPEPFQRSMRMPEPCPVLSVTAPEAQQEEALTQSIPLR